MPAEEAKFSNPLDAIDAAIDAAKDVEEGSATAGSARSNTVGGSAHVLPFDAAKRALHHAEESARGHAYCKIEICKPSAQRRPVHSAHTTTRQSDARLATR